MHKQNMASIVLAAGVVLFISIVSFLPLQKPASSEQTLSLSNHTNPLMLVDNTAEGASDVSSDNDTTIDMG